MDSAIFTGLRRRAWRILIGGTLCATIAAALITCKNDPKAISNTGVSSIDCVDLLHVRRIRGFEVANAQRVGGNNLGVRESRISALAPSDLRAVCDWEACMKVNGYGHACWVDDGGVERCRVCDGGADCSGLPVSQDDCVAHAAEPPRATCHVGLMQECLLQRGLRGPADLRVTQACKWSQQACDGTLVGDLTDKNAAARFETDQVTIETCCITELNQAIRLQPDSQVIPYVQKACAEWDGGLPPDYDAGTPIDGGPIASDSSADAAGKD